VTVIVDETSQLEHVHLLVAGIPIGGVVVPLALRTWPQNQALPDAEYWTQLLGLLQEIQAMLPPELREHVLLVADRAYGIPRLLDLLSVLGWHWLLRVQGQTQLRLPDGTCRQIRSLVPRPGTSWTSGFGPESTTEATPPDSEPKPTEPTEVFKAAGWRRSQVVAVWDSEADEPWLLLTSLTSSRERVAEYASRWAIERLFLSWKSHGWDIEHSGVHDPSRLGRLLTGLAIATLWRLAMALPKAFSHLHDLASRVSPIPRQRALPFLAAPPRPFAAKHSLLNWGKQVADSTSLDTRTPALCWRLPAWLGLSWFHACQHACLLNRRQFPASP